jgi:biopolymer transport protein ExbB
MPGHSTKVTILSFMFPILPFRQAEKPRQIRLLLVASAVLFSMITAPALLAEEADAAAAPPETTSLMDMIIGGGLFMIPIGILSIWMITLAVYLMLQLGKAKFIPLGLKEEIMANMAEVRVRSAIDAASQDVSFLGRLVTTSYPHIDATDPEKLGRSKVEDAMADFTIRESLTMMTNIGYLSVIAQGATMLGLFGTVAGMVLAFDSMGLSGGSDPGALAGNISLALITTAGGLVVAIPAIFLFYGFKNRYNRMISDAQQIVIEGVEAAIATVNADQMLARVPEGIAEV